jgi:hypothetical protein
MSHPIPDNALEQEYLYHYEISFQVKINRSNIEIEDEEISKLLAESDSEDIWIADEIIVRGTDDAEAVIQKAKAYCLNNKTTDYHLPATGWKLTGIALISVAVI